MILFTILSYQLNFSSLEINYASAHIGFGSFILGWSVVETSELWICDPQINWGQIRATSDHMIY